MSLFFSLSLPQFLSFLSNIYSLLHFMSSFVSLLLCLCFLSQIYSLLCPFALSFVYIIFSPCNFSATFSHCYLCFLVSPLLCPCYFYLNLLTVMTLLFSFVCLLFSPNHFSVTFTQRNVYLCFFVTKSVYVISLTHCYVCLCFLFFFVFFFVFLTPLRSKSFLCNIYSVLRLFVFSFLCLLFSSCYFSIKCTHHYICVFVSLSPL